MTLISSFVMAKVLAGVEVNSVPPALKVAFGLWLRFIASIMIMAEIYGSRSAKRLAVTLGYAFCCCLLVAVVLVSWR